MYHNHNELSCEVVLFEYKLGMNPNFKSQSYVELIWKDGNITVKGHLISSSSLVTIISHSCAVESKYLCKYWF